MIQRRKRTSTPKAPPTPSQRRSNALQVALSQDFSERDRNFVESLGEEIIDTIGSDKSSQVFAEIRNFIVGVQKNEDLARHCCDSVPLEDLQSYEDLQSFIYNQILGDDVSSNIPRGTKSLIDQQIILILNIVCKQSFPREKCDIWRASRSRREDMALELKRLEISKEELQLRREELALDRNGWQGELKRRLLTLFVILICIVAFGYFVDAKTLTVISSEIEKFSGAAVKCGDDGSFLCKSVYGYSLWDTLVTPTIYATAGIASKITTITDAVFKTLLAFVFFVVALVVMILPQEASAFGVFSYSMAAPSKRITRGSKSPSPKKTRRLTSPRSSKSPSPRSSKSPSPKKTRRLTSPRRR